MLTKDDLDCFLGLFVCVGIPSEINPEQLFYYYGFVKKVDEIEITLRTSKGFAIIPIEKIKKIYEARRK